MEKKGNEGNRGISVRGWGRKEGEKGREIKERKEGEKGIKEEGRGELKKKGEGKELKKEKKPRCLGIGEGKK